MDDQFSSLSKLYSWLAGFFSKTLKERKDLTLNMMKLKTSMAKSDKNMMEKKKKKQWQKNFKKLCIKMTKRNSIAKKFKCKNIHTHTQLERRK
jgi:hypothetical protein